MSASIQHIHKATDLIKPKLIGSTGRADYQSLDISNIGILAGNGNGLAEACQSA